MSRDPRSKALGFVLVLACAVAGCARWVDRSIAPADTAESAPEEKASMLEGLRWQKRPVLLFAGPARGARFDEALRAAESARADFTDRDMEVVTIIGDEVRLGNDRVETETATELRERFAVGAGFTAILIGKDGGEKGRVGRIASFDPWFTLVDSMPMRREEMRRR